MNSPPGTKLSDQSCPACSARLNIHDAVRGGYCHNARCQLTRARNAQAEQNRAREARRQFIARRYAQKITQSMGSNLSDSLPWGIVPANNLTVTRVPSRRRRQFLRHLLIVIRKAFSPETPSAGDITGNQQFAPMKRVRPEPDWVAKSCSACQGLCCRPGGTTAFVDENTIRRYIAGWPLLTARDVFRAYAHRLPKQAAQGSCVFHGQRGCALPREMRSDTCNRYRCESLNALPRMSATSESRPFLVIAVNESEVVRSSAIMETHLPP